MVTKILKQHPKKLAKILKLHLMLEYTALSVVNQI